MKTDGTDYRVGDVAKLLATSDQSVRGWSNEFAPLLGPGAVPDRNVERRYTAQDVRVLLVIQKRKRMRESHEVIVAALEEAIRADQLPPLPEMPLAGDVPAAVVASAREHWMIERAGLQTTITRLEQHAEQLQRQLVDEQQGRRADLERLLREIGMLQAEIARLKAQGG